MQASYIKDKTFDNTDFQLISSDYREFENGIFNNCTFFEQDLSNLRFVDCMFNGCNLSMVKLHNTALCNIKFRDCKMLGVHFNDCDEFGLSFSFENCQLDYSSFYKTKIKKTIFKKSQFLEVDFSECDLTGAIFDDCNLTRSVFDHTNLEKADFRTSCNFSIDPEVNRIKKAKFSSSGLAGLLDKYDIVIDTSF